MVSNYIDLTATLVANASATIDTSGYDDIVVTFVTPAGTINVQATNDGGDVTGVLPIGSAATATNFTTVQATKLADGTAVTVIAAAGQYKLSRVGRYVRFAGAGATAAKCIVQFNRIC
jgi:hypothetical protein